MTQEHQSQVPQALIMSSAVQQLLFQERTRHLPDECCGLLIGHENQISQIHALRNLMHEYDLNSPVLAALLDPTTRAALASNTAGMRGQMGFIVDPQEMVEAWGRVTQQGLTLVGSYHSHPTSAPIPSPGDIRALGQHPDLFHVIIGMMPGTTQAECAAYRITSEGATPYPLVIQDHNHHTERTHP